MTKKTIRPRKNQTDTTLRNLRPLKDRVLQLETHMQTVDNWLRELDAKVKALEAK